MPRSFTGLGHFGFDPGWNDDFLDNWWGNSASPYVMECRLAFTFENH
jgi:hypothetical protein